MKSTIRSHASGIRWVAGALVALLGSAAGHAQTAAEHLAMGKAALTDRDLDAAQNAFASVLGIAPGHEEGNFYLGLVELLRFAEGAELANALAAANAEPVFDRDTLSLDFTWSELAATEAALREAVLWQFVTDPTAVDGDALRADSYESTIPGSAESRLTTDVLTGPGTVRFRYRTDGVSISPNWLNLVALDAVEPWGWGLGNWELNQSTWQEASARLEEGTFRLQWGVYSHGWGPQPNPSVFLDQFEFIPDAGPASPLDDGSTSGPSLANGLDNADFALESEAFVYVDYADSDFLDPDFNTAVLQDLIGGPLRLQLEASLAHLAAVSSTDFRSDLIWNSDPQESVTIDFGDVLLFRAGLEAALMLAHMVHADNLAIKPTEIDALSALGALGTTQATLTVLPDLLKRIHPEAGPLAEAAFRRAFALYSDASHFVRARPEDGATHVFNLAPEQREDEAAFRDEFARVIAALDTPETIEVDASQTVSVDLGALFDSGTDLRALLPVMEGDTIVAGTFPDPTLNGLLSGMDAGTLEKILRADDQLADQPADFETLTVQSGAAIGSGLAHPQVVVTGVSDDGDRVLLAVLREGGLRTRRGDWRRYLWRRTAGTIERIDLGPGGQPFDTVTDAQLSGDGQSLFLTVRDAGLLGMNPAQIVSVALDAPVFRAPGTDPGDPFLDTRQFPVTAAAPNGATGRSVAEVRLTLLDERDWFHGNFQLESPTGEVFNSSLQLERWNGRATGMIRFFLGSGPTEDFTGVWTLRLTQSFGGCCGEPEVAVEALQFFFDGAPFVLARRPLAGGAWEVLSKTATGMVSATDSLLGLTVNQDGTWAGIVAVSDDLVPELIGAYPTRSRPPQSFLIDCTQSAARRLAFFAGSSATPFGSVLSISASGERMAFSTWSRLAPADTNDLPDVYVFDRTDESMTLASVSASGFVQENGDWGGGVTDLVLRADGAAVAFASTYATLREDAPTSNGFNQTVYLRDLDAATTTAISPPDADAGGPALSSDGRFVSFHAYNYYENGFDRYLHDRVLDITRLLVPALDAELIANSNGINIPFGPTWIARGTDLAVLMDDRGSLYTHAFEASEAAPWHLAGAIATRVTMGQPGLYLSDEGASVGIPVVLHSGTPAPTSPVSATFTTTGFSALPWRNYRDDALAVTLTTANPTQTLTIPLHSHAFLASLGVFEVELETVSSPARIGSPRSTFVALPSFPDPDRYAAWLLEAFPDPVQRDDPMVSGPLIDPEGDGWINLLEFALGWNPLGFDEAPPVRFSPATVGARDTFTVRYNTRSGLRFYLEISSHLDGWTRYELENFEVVDVADLGAGILELTLRWPYAQHLDRFYRLVIEGGP